MCANASPPFCGLVSNICCVISNIESVLKVKSVDFVFCKLVRLAALVLFLLIHVKLPPIGYQTKPIKAFCIGTHKTIHFDIINAEIRMLCVQPWWLGS